MLCERGMVQKRCFYEWSSRIPLIVRFPDGRFAGRTISSPCSLLDVGTTLIELAEAAIEDAPLVDGVSLMEYMNNSDYGRDIFVEYHGEGVMHPCFMVRRGNYKYTYIHEYETQLFDISKDPDERNNLSGKLEYNQLEDELKSSILSRFSPEAVRKYIGESLKKRSIVRESNKIQGVSWDYSPNIDDSRRY